MTTKNKNYQFTYTHAEGKTSGFFNIYQAKNGGIYVVMGNGSTVLTPTQIAKLGINVYNLDGFNHDEYLAFYAENTSFI